MSTKKIFDVTNKIKSISKTESFRADATDLDHLSLHFLVITQTESSDITCKIVSNSICLNSSEAISLANAILAHYQVKQ